LTYAQVFADERAPVHGQPQPAEQVCVSAARADHVPGCQYQGPWQ
jgi:hypothetical protein